MIVAELLRTLAAPTDTTRLLQLSTALPEAALVVERFSGDEAISDLGVFTIECLSVSAHWPVDQLLDQEVTLRLLQAEGGYRHFHGYVRQAAQLESDGGLARYRLQLVPWLSLLDLRHDCRVFQDQSVQDIVVAVFAQHPQARYRFEVSSPGVTKALCTQFNESDLTFVQRLLAEQGWSYRFEHAQQAQVSAPGDATQTPPSHHTLVIFDRQAALPPCTQPVIRFHRNALAERSDAIECLSEHVKPVPTQVTVHSFDERAVASVSGQASIDLSAVLGSALPSVEHYVDASPGLYRTGQAATEAAQLLQAALALPARTFTGAGAVRALQAGTQFSLSQHDYYQGDTSRFTVSRVTHHGCNNLGSEAVRLLDDAQLKDGGYRNTFSALPASMPVVIAPPDLPRRLGRAVVGVAVGPWARPQQAQLDTAWVVGVQGEAITTHREHCIKVQFAWQRGQHPNAGGLTQEDNEIDPAGRAPGNEQAGIWVRVSEALAGPNFGSVFTPRIGTEVVVGYLHGDIDCPLVVGQAYNGADLPPFSAGQDSAANHPGVLKGIHTQGLSTPDDYNQWQSDATPTQLRTRLASSTTHSELNLGYLIAQPPGSAQRGAYRGAGAELTTEGWLVTRVGEGLLISSTARPDQGHSAPGAQLDIQEAVAQLQGGADLQQRLAQAAGQAQALTPGGDAIAQSIKSVDPAQDGHYHTALNGQAASQPSGTQGAARFSGGAPIPKFAQPHLLLETPDDRLTVTPGSLMQYAAGDLTHLTQGARHDSSDYTHSQVSGRATSLFAQRGGLQFIAANGPLSVQAHAGELSALSSEALTLTSVNGQIEITAPTQITLQAGDTKIELNGPHVTFSTPGAVQLKGNMKQIAKTLTGGTALPVLPSGAVTVPRIEGIPSIAESEKYDIQFLVLHPRSRKVAANMRYKISLGSGHQLVGTTDANGLTERISSGRPETAQIKVPYDDASTNSNILTSTTTDICFR